MTFKETVASIVAFFRNLFKKPVVSQPSTVPVVVVQAPVVVEQKPVEVAPPTPAPIAPTPVPVHVPTITERLFALTPEQIEARNRAVAEDAIKGNIPRATTLSWDTPGAWIVVSGTGKKEYLFEAKGERLVEFVVARGQSGPHCSLSISRDGVQLGFMASTTGYQQVNVPVTSGNYTITVDLVEQNEVALQANHNAPQ